MDDQELLVDDCAERKVNERVVNVIKHLGIVFGANLSFEIVQTVDTLLFVISTTKLK